MNLYLPITLLAALVLTAGTPEAQKEPWKEGKKPGAQGGAKPEKKTPKDRKVADKVRQKRQEQERSRLGATNIMVEVTLRNGEKISGIVKQGRLVEKRRGRGYVKARRQDPTAGIRLFYFNRTSSVMFIPYIQVGKVKEVRRLSDVEVKKHGKRILEKANVARAKARERARKRIAAIKARQEAEAKIKGKLEKMVKKMEQDAKEKAARAVRAKLLEEFPPGKEWSADRIKAIQLRKINGIYPTKQEIRFIQVFEEWSQAVKESKATGAGEPAEKK